MFAKSFVLLLAATSALAYPAGLGNRTFTAKTLKIMPLGDSITAGYLSSTGNGYRQDLLNGLPNNKITLVGSQKDGSMANPQNEGFFGYEIDQIKSSVDSEDAEKVYSPDVILMHVGTNDVNKNYDVSGAPSRLNDLIKDLFINLPDATIILAQITPIANAASEARRVTFNAAIPGVAETFAKQGKKILTVDMGSQVTTADLKDGLHLTDGGYQKMANVWIGGLNSASSKGWF